MKRKQVQKKVQPFAKDFEAIRLKEKLNWDYDPQTVIIPNLLCLRVNYLFFSNVG